MKLNELIQFIMGRQKIRVGATKPSQQVVLSDGTMAEQLTIPPKPDIARSSKWPGVRAEHLKYHPACVCCGETKGVEVHHIYPVHVAPIYELDPSNLITLCPFHHFDLGHMRNWKLYNAHIVLDAMNYRSRFLTVRQRQEKKSA